MSCKAHGQRAIMTRADHPSGTDRLAEAARKLKLKDNDIVVNVQGDEPLIAPALIAQVAASLGKQTQGQRVHRLPRHPRRGRARQSRTW